MHAEQAPETTKATQEHDPLVPAAHESHGHQSSLALLALTALGVVYGDIGTSPLYALRESFHGTHAIAPTPNNIYGVLSLVFWSLIIVITIKYITFILRADNRGEGGILALMALATPIRPLSPTARRWIVLLGVFGAALLYGDGVITPAISVLSAVEGLTVATPLFDPYVIPITVAIIVGLFVIQSRGTAIIGRLFGPVMLVWFGVLIVLGVIHIAQMPEILAAVNPLYGLSFFAANGWRGFLVLGTVFLVVTGGEALYADMGHVGARSIRLAWMFFVLPALLINYFGQGVLLIREPEAASKLFYLMAPPWALYPLVILSALATIIASQALISGVFSLTMQAENLGFLPRLRIVHTSSAEFGQIYIPFVNWLLMAATILVVIGFRTSGNLAAAYGIAVTATMAITTLIFMVVIRERWCWNPVVVALLIGFFLIVDLAFFAANLVKIPQGGWFSLAVAAIIFAVMTTWKRGSRLVFHREQHMEMSLDDLLKQLREDPPLRAKGTSVVLSANPQGAPAALLANLRYNCVVHEQILLVNVIVSEKSYVSEDKRFTIEPLGEGIYHITIRFGFMEDPNVPNVIASIQYPGLTFDPESVPYFVNRTRPIPSQIPGMAPWRERLYADLRRNSVSAADFFRLPPSRIFEIGTSVEF